MEFSDLETELCMNHLDRRWKEICLIKDANLRMKEKKKFYKKEGEIVEDLSRILESSHQDRPEYHPFGPGG